MTQQSNPPKHQMLTLEQDLANIEGNISESVTTYQELTARVSQLKTQIEQMQGAAMYLRGRIQAEEQKPDEVVSPEPAEEVGASSAKESQNQADNEFQRIAETPPQTE